MDTWKLERQARNLPSTTSPLVTIDGRDWQYVSVDADDDIMREIEGLPVARFLRIARAYARSATGAAVQANTPWSLVIIGDQYIGMRRAFLDPAGQPCVLDYVEQQCVQDALAAAVVPREEIARTRSHEPAAGRCMCGVPITDELLRLVIREIVKRPSDEATIAARLGLSHARVREVLQVAEDVGLAEFVPLH